MFELYFHDQTGLCKLRTGWRMAVADGGWRMADGGWQMGLDGSRWLMADGRWKNEDDEMRMEKCGWKADGKMRMTKSR